MASRARLAGVGVFVLGTVILFGVAVFMIGDRQMAFTRRFEIYTEFAKVTGLQNGAIVRVAGARAGEVTDIAPPSTRALRRPGSMLTLFISEVRTTTVSSRPWAASGAALWPVLCGAILSPFSAAARTSAETSAVVCGRATAAGRWSTATFHGIRAPSYSASPGR